MKKKPPTQKLRAIYKKLPKRRYLISIGLLVVILGVCAYIINGSNKSGQQNGSTSNTSVKTTSTSTLHVDSNVAGVSMQGVPYCGIDQIHKPTPYDCSLTNGQSETVITAPTQATVSGKTYTFVTWDGCSESNSNKAVCKIKVSNNKDYIIKATYELYKPSLAGQNTKPFTSVAAEPVIRCGPINYGDYPNGGCGLDLATKTKVLIKASFAPDCDSYHAGIEIRCRNQPTFYPGHISPSIEFWCNSDPKTPCGFVDPYSINTFEPGSHIIRIPSPGTFDYASGSGQANLGNLTGSYDKQTNTININASYVAPVKDESYPKCCSP